EPVEHLSEFLLNSADKSKRRKSVHVHTQTQSFASASSERNLSSVSPSSASGFLDLSDIKGQEQAKRALIIAAAGGHHLLLKGPPGVGKTMLARALPSILSPLSREEHLEVLQIYSCAGYFVQSDENKNTNAGNGPGSGTAGAISAAAKLSATRPFRSAHPTSTLLALTGGGSQLKPGEISLAHHGVLFLDELPEFSRAHLESLRQPLEEKQITIARNSGAVTFPANFTLIASMNPCPCGYFGDPKKECVCRPYQVMQYQKKISGPILDRIDLHVELERQPPDVYERETKENSEEIRKKVAAARLIQKERGCLNADLKPREIKSHCQLEPEAAELLASAALSQQFSGRAYHQTIKVARTIADLKSHNPIQAEDMAEALQYRHRAGRAV
ncbi:MAG TPA: ATP-binding protein, partial [Candidatus Gracilibacteria bacterium]|nr:ATP-binding protein [Candidatus Gracilibacteria bacterium]